jgi:hypothetical protein
MVPVMPLQARNILARRLPWGVTLSLAALVLAAPALRAAATPRAAPEADVKLLPALVAAEVVAGGNAAGAVGLLSAGRAFALWGDWPAKPPAERDRAEAIDHDLLAAVKDLTGRPDPQKNAGEFRAWNETAFIAAQTPPRALANSARDNGDLRWVDLLRDAAKYRGRVVHVAGRLVNLRRETTPQWLQERGVKDLYEGQVLVHGLGDSPVLVRCTELPADLRPGNELSVPVALDGYFLKKLLYRTDREVRVLPLVVGRVLRLDKAAAVAADPDRAPDIDALLVGVKDYTGPAGPNKVEEFWGYCETVRLAARTPQRAFAANARAHQDVTFAHLLGDPATYRGQVVPITGRLKRLLEVEVPDQLKERGVRRLYEGWVYGPTPGSNPFCVLFTDLPRDLHTGANVDYPVGFEGYFFKDELYGAAKDKRNTPMLIGRTIHRAGPERAVPTRPAARKEEEPDDPQARAPTIPQDLLDDVVDGTRAATGRTNAAELVAYCETVLAASKTSARAFANSARETAGLTYEELLTHPERYRGKVVHVEGPLGRLRRFEAPAYLQARGISHLYEGWVLNRARPRRPWCLIFTDLPDGIRVGEQVDYQVTFDGYFFKKYKYRAGDTDFYAPQVLGRTLAQPVRVRGSGAGAFSTVFVITLTALVGGIIFLVVGLSWWFRRGDRSVRARLAGAVSAPGFDPAHAAAPAELPDGGPEPPGEGGGPPEDDRLLRNGH